MCYSSTIFCDQIQGEKCFDLRSWTNWKTKMRTCFFQVTCFVTSYTAEMRLVFNMHKTVGKELNDLEKLGKMELVWEPNASL